MSASEREHATNSYIANHNVAFVDSASTAYNCNSYAWVMYEGGPTCNDVDWEKFYTAPASYCKTDSSSASKVLFYEVSTEADHSAVRIGPGMYVSKCGDAPLVSHTLENTPAYERYTKIEYYRRCASPVGIIGPLSISFSDTNNKYGNPSPFVYVYMIDKESLNPIVLYNFRWEVEGLEIVEASDTWISVRNTTTASSVVRVYNGNNPTPFATKTTTKTNVPVISGPDNIACSPGVFSISDTTTTVSRWEVGTGFQIIDTAQNKLSVTVKSLHSGTSVNTSATLTAYVVCNGATIPVSTQVIAQFNPNSIVPSIIESFFSCNGNSTFTLNNYGLSLSNYSWSVSNNLQIISQDKNKIIISHCGTPPCNISYYNTDIAESGYVQVNFTVSGCVTMSASKTIFPAIPQTGEYAPLTECNAADISDGYDLCPGKRWFYTAEDTNGVGNNSAFVWYKNGNLVGVSTLTGIDVNVGYNDSFTLYVAPWFPKCGSMVAGGYNGYFTSNYCNDYFCAYPNPATVLIHVEINPNAFAQVQTRTATGGNTIRKVSTFDIRLYDGQGNQLRQANTKGDKVEFNVENLPDGIYYLHVYDGINPTPEIQQIIVKH